MEVHEYQVMANVERVHPWFVNRRRLIAALLGRFARHIVRPRLLDAGSGTGVNLADYSSRAWAVGVEIDRHAAGISRARGNIRVLTGDLCHLPFATESFDVVVSTDVIEHIDDDVAALAEMSRVLRPGGRIMITTPAYSWAYSEHDRQLHHVRRYDLDRLRWAFRRASLKLLHLGRYNVLLAPPLLAARWILDRRGRNGSDVGRPVPAVAAPVLDFLWHLEAAFALRLDLRFGLTHVAVLAAR